MKLPAPVLVLVSLVVGGVVPMAYAQPLIEIRDIQVKPALIAQYEAAHKDGIVFREENAFPFVTMAFQAEPGVYRYVTFLGDWAGRERIDQWFAPFLAGEPSDFVRPLFEAIESHSVSYERNRSNLTYNPEDAPVTVADAGVVHELRLYPMAHTVRQVANVLERFASVYEAHDVPVYRTRFLGHTFALRGRA